MFKFLKRKKYQVLYIKSPTKVEDILEAIKKLENENYKYIKQEFMYYGEIFMVFKKEINRG